MPQMSYAVEDNDFCTIGQCTSNPCLHLKHTVAVYSKSAPDTAHKLLLMLKQIQDTCHFVGSEQAEHPL